MEREGKNLLGIFFFTFIFTAMVGFLAYALGGFEVAALVALCLIAAIISTVAVGIENTIGKELATFRAELKGYLLDMYAEMIKKD